MTIRFFILQTHYRSTLDFSNEALQAAEKGLKRLWEAYEFLKLRSASGGPELPLAIGRAEPQDKELAARSSKLMAELDDFMNDDFSTAKVLANLFELVPTINSIKDKHISPEALGADFLNQLREKFKVYLEDILGFRGETGREDDKLKGVLELLIDMRKEARARKDYASSDKIRNQLLQLGIALKDEKDGGMSYNFQ